MDADAFALLDRSDIRSMMFYPRPDRLPPPPGVHDLTIETEGAALHGRCYPGDASSPCVLLFHGNGEIVSDYDDLAPIYRHFGINLLVTDYRGYGRSTGQPAFTAMLADAHAVKDAAFGHWRGDGCTGARFLMGRSLGALSAVELAATAPDGFAGLVLESGAAGIRGWQRFAGAADSDAWDRLRRVQRERIGRITMPLLTIHGEWDELVLLDAALETRDAAASADKDLCIIPHAGHNDLLAAGVQRYFGALAAFMERHGTVRDEFLGPPSA